MSTPDYPKTDLEFMLSAKKMVSEMAEGQLQSFDLFERMRRIAKQLNMEILLINSITCDCTPETHYVVTACFDDNDGAIADWMQSKASPIRFYRRLCEKNIYGQHRVQVCAKQASPLEQLARCAE